MTTSVSAGNGKLMRGNVRNFKKQIAPLYHLSPSASFKLKLNHFPTSAESFQNEHSLMINFTEFVAVFRFFWFCFILRMI